MKKIIFISFFLFSNFCFSQTKIEAYKFGKDSIYYFGQEASNVTSDTLVGIGYNLYLYDKYKKFLITDIITIPFYELVLFKGVYDLETYIIRKKNFKRL